MMCHSTSTEGLVESFSIEPTALEDFKDAPDSLCTRVLLTDEEAKVHYNIFIQVGCLLPCRSLALPACCCLNGMLAGQQVCCCVTLILSSNAAHFLSSSWPLTDAWQNKLPSDLHRHQKGV